ncbi:MAG: glycosyltransferase family A protein [Anaerolineales bacterium]
MTRIGMNPARKVKSSYQPQEVTVGMLTYIPSLEGYFQDRMNVLKLSVSSLVAHTEIPFDFFVFDNGSCPEVIQYLRDLNEKGIIDYLLLSSQNIGVEGGVRILSQATIGKYFAYSNDDVYYYPGWLKAHLRILETYPKVGMVSGTPVGFASEHGNQSTTDFINSDVPGLEVTQRDRVQAWEIDWAKSTGRDVDEHLKTVQHMPHIMLNYRGVEAISSATHFQFVSPQEVIPAAFSDPWHENLMGGVVEMDQRVDEMGLLRLSTPGRVTRHIGNAISPELRKEVEMLGLELDAPIHRATKKHWLLTIPGSGRLLRSLYDWLFKVLHHLE